MPQDNVRVELSNRADLAAAVHELERRKRDALRLYRPLPRAEAFHRSAASERILRGGNQCTSLDTPIPTARGVVCAGQVQVGDEVIGGRVVHKWVSPEPVPTYKLDCEGGFELVCSAEHPVLTESGRFIRMADLRPGMRVKLAVGEWLWSKSVMSPEDGYFCGLMIGDGSVTGFSGTMCLTSADPELHAWVREYLSVASRTCGKPTDLQFCSSALKEKMCFLWGMAITTAHHKRIPAEVFKDREVARQFLRGYTDTDGCVDTKGARKERCVIWVSASEGLLRDVQQLLLAFGVYAVLSFVEKKLSGKLFPQWRLRARGPWADAFMLRVGCGLSRKQDPYPLAGVEKLPTEKLVKVRRKTYCHRKHVVGFTVEPTNTYVTAGIWSHNSSKTTSAAVEFASAARKFPLTGGDGQPITFRYPMNRPLLMWVTGYDQAHIGGTIYSKLFKPGAFSIIRDRRTGEWRSWRPWEPEDKAREDEAEPAPPLIPEWCIDERGWGWENKAERVFTVCRLKSGTEIRAFPSGGNVPQGSIVDVIWIDEDIVQPSLVGEMRMRQGRCRGRFFWSAWPHSANDALVKMSERAADQVGREHPDIIEVVLRFSDNPFIPQDEKRRILEGYSDEERRSRDLGDFLTDTILVFPSFNPETHCLPSRTEPDRLEKFLVGRNGKIPFDWTTYLVLDPGHTQPAVLLAAVPPPAEFGDYVVVFDEVYVPRINADELAELVRAKVMGRVIEAFIIDHRYGRQTSVGTGKTIASIYSEAFRRKGLCSRSTGSGFIYGSDDIQARNMVVRGWLGPDPNGKPKLRLIADTTPATQKEFSLYRKRVLRDAVREEVVDRNNHLMDCLGYLAAFGPTYVERDDQDATYNPIVRLWRQLEKQAGVESDTVWIGPGRHPVESALPKP